MHIQSLAVHAAALTCLAWNEGQGTLTSGDAAGLVVVWAAAPGGWAKQMASQRYSGCLLIVTLSWPLYAEHNLCC